MEIGHYKPRPHDLSIISAIDYILENATSSDGIRFRRDILGRIGLSDSSYCTVKKRWRGIPAYKVKHICKVLVEEFNINEKFIETNEGPIVPELWVAKANVGAATVEKIQLLETLILEKDKRISDLEEIISLLKRQ